MEGGPMGGMPMPARGPNPGGGCTCMACCASSAAPSSSPSAVASRAAAFIMPPPGAAAGAAPAAPCSGRPCMLPTAGVYMYCEGSRTKALAAMLQPATTRPRQVAAVPAISNIVAVDMPGLDERMLRALIAAKAVYMPTELSSYPGGWHLTAWRLMGWPICGAAGLIGRHAPNCSDCRPWTKPGRWRCRRGLCFRPALDQSSLSPMGTAVKPTDSGSRAEPAMVTMRSSRLARDTNTMLGSGCMGCAARMDCTVLPAITCRHSEASRIAAWSRNWRVMTCLPSGARRVAVRWGCVMELSLMSCTASWCWETKVMVRGGVPAGTLPALISASCAVLASRCMAISRRRPMEG
mmetsp:Transcript_21625/g.55056  ORF Transcript_21625/g.55056 Transcript_21625/m.55056 type:complete len:350 (+) Transcript_21625:1063-2112(+)